MFRESLIDFPDSRTSYAGILNAQQLYLALVSQVQFQLEAKLITIEAIAWSETRNMASNVNFISHSCLVTSQEMTASSLAWWSGGADLEFFRKSIEDAIANHNTNSIAVVFSCDFLL